MQALHPVHFAAFTRTTPPSPTCDAPVGQAETHAASEHWLQRSERCNQCSDAPCVGACPTGASHVGEGGVVLVNAAKCTGCKACMASCPYGARYVHPAGHVDKCTFCLHRVERGQTTACAEVCPTRSLTFGDLSDPESPVARLLASRRNEVTKPEAGTKPNVFFLL